jgi:hypothetical protein
MWLKETTETALLAGVVTVVLNDQFVQRYILRMIQNASTTIVIDRMACTRDRVVVFPVLAV